MPEPHQTTDELLAICQAARNAGRDFPAIWQDVLKRHPLVGGMPVQVLLGNKPALSIQLVDGRHLFFGEDGFSLA